MKKLTTKKFCGRNIDFSEGGGGRDMLPYKRYTVCPRSSDPFYIVTYYLIWVTTSWTGSKYLCNNAHG